MQRRIIILASAITLLVLALVGSTLCIAYTDREFICENTGSRHGYREWFFAARTREWTETSELDRFMQTYHKDRLQHRWTSYRGDGQSLLAGVQSKGHGRPGSILMLSPGMLDSHVSGLTDSGKLALYELFASADEKIIRGEVEKIFESTGRR